MSNPLELDESGRRIKVTDATIMRLIKHRMDLALEVGKRKSIDMDPIFRKKVEDERIEKIRSVATSIGLNEHFAVAVLYALINESCKQQMIQLQEQSTVAPLGEAEEYQILKGNLLRLTERWCSSYDESYTQDYFATRAYVAYEAEILAREVHKLSTRTLAIDLGCATGQIATKLATDFDCVIGYDLSQHMVTTAVRQANTGGFSEEQLTFEQADLESGIPLPDASVSFVAMTLGTAGDMRNFAFVWNEIQRVLVPGGRFLLSFYNRDALLYQWELLPWDSGLAAAIDMRRDSLEVHIDSERIPIYARAYTVEEVQTLLGDANELELLTFPTISSILPPELFDNQSAVQEAVTTIDRSLASSKLGAYIIATGQKK